MKQLMMLGLCLIVLGSAYSQTKQFGANQTALGVSIKKPEKNVKYPRIVITGVGDTIWEVLDPQMDVVLQKIQYRKKIIEKMTLGIDRRDSIIMMQKIQLTQKDNLNKIIEEHMIKAEKDRDKFRDSALKKDVEIRVLTETIEDRDRRIKSLKKFKVATLSILGTAGVALLTTFAVSLMK